MTRIFDALKKAEAAREGAPAPTSLGRPAGGVRPDDIERSALPLLGGIDLGEDVLREMAALRVSLESTLRDRSPRVVMLLGPQGGEGTSTVALQFAQSLARDPVVRPLLVDCHSRRPAYAVDESQRCAVLDPRFAGGAGNEGAMLNANLFVVPVSEAHRRAGLMQPAALRQLLDANVSGFDWIVLDGPPVLEAPDASALGAVADGVLLVVQAGRTKRPVLTRAADLLAKAGARALGSVLNRRVMEISGFIYRRI